MNATGSDNSYLTTPLGEQGPLGILVSALCQLFERVAETHEPRDLQELYKAIATILTHADRMAAKDVLAARRVFERTMTIPGNQAVKDTMSQLMQKAQNQWKSVQTVAAMLYGAMAQRGLCARYGIA
jgi:hypothetical protein